MADQNLTVKISADVTSLQAQSAIAKTELSSLNATVKDLATQFVGASDEMKASLAPQLDATAQKAAAVKSQIAAMTAEMKAANGEMAASVHPEVTSFFGQMSENVRVTGESLESLHTRLNVVSDALGAFSELVMAGMGVEMITDQVDKVAELGESYAQLTEKTGATTQQLAALKLAAMETGTDFDVVGNGLRSLGTKMQEAITNPSSVAAQAFSKAGITIRDSATGEMLPVVDVFAQISAAMSNYEDGTAKTALAGDMLGTKFGSSLIPVMNTVGTNFDGLQAKAQDYGLAMSGPAVEGSEQFMQAQKDLGAQMEGMRAEIVGGLLPGLAALMSGEDEVSGQSFIMGTAINSVEVVLKGLVGTAAIVIDAVKMIGAVCEETAQEGIVLADSMMAAGAAMEMNFKAAKEDAVAASSLQKTAVSDATASIIGDYKNIGDVLGALRGDMSNAPLTPPKPQAPSLGDTSAGGAWMADQTAALAQQNQQIEANATSTKEANTEKLQNTVQFWQGVLQAGNLSSAQELAAQTQLTKAETSLKANQLSDGTAAAKTAATEETQIATDAANARKQIAQSEYQVQVSQWDAEVAQKKITKAQEIQDEIAAENQMYQAALAEAEQEATLSSLTVAQKAKALDDIEVMTAAHNADLAKLNADLVTQQVDDAKTLQDAQQKAAEATAAAWQKAVQPISQAFDSSINGILQGTQTLQQAELKTASSIALAYIDAAAKQVMAYVSGDAQALAHHVAAELGMTAATQAGATARVASQQGANATGKALDAASSSSQINNAAYTAAAKAYQAVVGIPYVGPVLAPLAAATAYAGVMAFDVLSAEGGMTIPSGTNPLTQLHENEMVLPAYIAQPLQSMVASGGSAAGGSSTSGATSLTYAPQINMPGGSGTSDLQATLSESAASMYNWVQQNYGRNGALTLPGR